MDKRGRPGYVNFTIELPVEVADYLSEHSQQIVAGLKQAVKRYHQNPPVPSSEGKKSSEELVRDRHNALMAIGRVGYRYLRRRIGTDEYFTASGTITKRTRDLSQTQWRAQIIKDVSDELSISALEADFSIRKFRSDLNRKIKPRRNQAIIRLYLSGSSNVEIADRVSVSTTFVSNFLSDNNKEIRKLFKALPETHKPLKRKKKGVVPGKTMSAGIKGSEKHSGKHSGESN